MIFITLQSGEARNQIQDLGKLLGRPRSIVQAAVRSTRTRLQRHFTERDRTGNIMGGRRTHFWQDIRKSTQVGEVTDRYGFVVIGDPRFAQKLFGGTIVAKEKEALTIPVAPEAYGRRAETLERELGIKLFVVSREFGNGLLAAAFGNEIKVFYVLKKSVDQDADPEALPPRQELEDAAIDGARTYVETTVRNSQPR